jgi:hypothetical protein
METEMYSAQRDSKHSGMRTVVRVILLAQDKAAYAQMHSKVSEWEGARKVGAPSAANIGKPANPARPKLNQQVGTEQAHKEVTNNARPWERCYVSHNASEGIEPRNIAYCTGSRVPLL